MPVLPESHPPARGDHARSDSPSSSQTGSSSHSVLRTRRLYSACRLTGADHPRALLRHSARTSWEAVKFEAPMYLTFPERTRSSKARSVSSSGVDMS